MTPISLKQAAQKHLLCWCLAPLAQEINSRHRLPAGHSAEVPPNNGLGRAELLDWGDSQI